MILDERLVIFTGWAKERELYKTLKKTGIGIRE